MTDNYKTTEHVLRQMGFSIALTAFALIGASGAHAKAETHEAKMQKEADAKLRASSEMWSNLEKEAAKEGHTIIIDKEADKKLDSMMKLWKTLERE